jgi:hypothetical protein
MNDPMLRDLECRTLQWAFKLGGTSGYNVGLQLHTKSELTEFHKGYPAEFDKFKCWNKVSAQYDTKGFSAKANVPLEPWTGNID